MLRLDSVTSVLQAVLAGAITSVQPQATVCFSDDVATTATYTGGKQVTVLNSTTDVTICAAPAAATVRDIDTVTIHNRDTATVTVSVKYDISGTDSTIVRATLLTLETLQFNHGDGWKVIAADGSIKTSSSGGSASPTGPAGGDLSGTYPNPTVSKINGVALGSTVAISGNMLIADGTSWVSRSISGDLTISSLGVATIPAGSISLDELSDVVITAPATGATLIFDGVNWIDGALNLADTDAVTGILPFVNGGTGVTSLAALATVLALIQPATGRLTLTTLVPVMTSTVSGATTIYYTPYVGSRIAIYDGTNWTSSIFTQLSQTTTDTTKSPAVVAANSNYDLFVWNDAGTLRCTRGPAWTSDTARGTGAGTTELVRQDGILMNAASITNGPVANRGTYVGTVRSNGSATIDWNLGSSAAGGGEAKLYVWNMYNRVDLAALVNDSNSSWSYSTATWRSADNSNTMRISVVRGLNEDAFIAKYDSLLLTNSVVNGSTAVGLDSTSGGFQSTSTAGNLAGVFCPGHASYEGFPGLGFHYLQALEFVTGVSCNFYGITSTYIQTGLHGHGLM